MRRKTVSIRSNALKSRSTRVGLLFECHSGTGIVSMLKRCRLMQDFIAKKNNRIK